MHFDFGGDCIAHLDCECDLNVSGIDPIEPFVVPRYKDGIKRSLNLMYCEMTAHLSQYYSLEGHELVKNLVPNISAYLGNLMRASAVIDSDVMRPQFEYSNQTKSIPRVNSIFLRDATCLLDKWYFARLGVNMAPYVWGGLVTELIPNQMYTLRELCAKTLSYSHYSCGKRYGNYSWCSTLEQYGPDDVFRNFNEFNVNNSTRGAGYHDAVQYLATALNIVYDNFIDSRQHFKKILFAYNPLAYVREMNLMSSSGIRPGPSSVGVIDGIKVVVSPIGKKIEQIKWAITSHRDWVRDLFSGNFRHLESHCVIKVKFERKCGYAKLTSELPKLFQKKREFFITNARHQLNSTWINGPRIKLERGNAINIGRSWWYGGALNFARYLNYDVPGMRWYEGDYRLHDKHIVDWLLMVYQAANVAYYNFDDMPENQRAAFLYANADTLFNMVIKPTCHSGDIWRILRGSLYSGGKETSHAGSFCTLLCFAIYLARVMKLYPLRAEYIKQCLKSGFIRICVYGDDHLWCAPATLADILNEREFAIYSKFAFGMEIKDILHHDIFLSKFSELTGELTLAGPKFLKRYFIAGVVLPVLPFKPMSETLQKLLAPTSELPVDMILRSIGQAWDTQFTNPVAYQACALIYREMLNLDPRSPSQILEEANLNDREYFNLTRKLSISADLLRLGFPDYNQRRREFHTYDAVRSNFVQTDPHAQLYEDYIY